MLEITLHNARQHQQFQHIIGPLVLARAGAEQAIWNAIDCDPAARVDALLEILPQGDDVAVAMSGCERECKCDRTCELKGNCRLRIPAAFTIGDTRFEIAAVDDKAATVRPLQRLNRDQAGVPRGPSRSAGPSPQTLSRWFAALGELNFWAASLQELYVQAAKCAVNAVGLDGAMVLRRRDSRWEFAASYLPHPELGIHCDLVALDELLKTPETLFHGADSLEPAYCLRPQLPLPPGEGRNEGESPITDAPSPNHLPKGEGTNTPAVVISPLRNSTGQVVGAIYGYRSVRKGNARRGIRYLEAHWIELLAGAVTDGIVRLEREAEVDRRRVMLERALVATLDNDPHKMLGETREVSLLFADLRDFTRLSATLETNVVYELLGHVMDCLTAAVMDHDGLVIDYYGDGLAAMWNAPADQSNHAELACRAGLRMLESVPEIIADWGRVIDQPLQLGVGIHTGPAHVGNAGSTRRMKYGPRGANVNLTSRVEAATKAIGLPLVITNATAAQLSNRFATHRICRATLPGVKEPLELFSVAANSANSASNEAWPTYARALHAFEQGELDQAAAELAKIDASNVAIPTRFLNDHIQRELGRQRHRRADDQPSSSRSIIALTEK